MYREDSYGTCELHRKGSSQLSANREEHCVNVMDSENTFNCSVDCKEHGYHAYDREGHARSDLYRRLKDTCNMDGKGNNPNALGLNGVVWVELKDLDGSVSRRDTFGNLIMDSGRIQAARLIGGVSTQAFNWIALGTASDAAAASETALVAELTDGGLERAQDASPTVNSVTLQIDYAFTATASNTVYEVGLFNSSAAGAMLARQTCGPYGLVSGNQIAVTWNIECKSSA